MDDKRTRTRPLTPAQRHLLEAAERIRMDRPTLDDIAYMARELVQVTLPHRNPGDVPEWTRSNGNLTLSIRPGWTTDQKTGQRRPIGYPYGSIPRLLLFWLTAEAVQTKKRQIELGNSLADFMFQLGLNADNGSVGAKRSDARRLREQMQRLFNAVINFEQAIIGDGRRGEHRVNMTVASGSMLWWSPRDPCQAALWGSWVELSKEFFDTITAYPIPLDMRALKALKRSPLALDLYSWLSYEAYRAHKNGKGRFVAWRLLAQQLGTDYAEVTNFQQKAVATLRKIQALYPALKLGALRGGIRVEPDSLPAITPRPASTVEQPAGRLKAIEGRQVADLPTHQFPECERPAWLLAVARELERQWPGESGHDLLAECLHQTGARKGLLDAFLAAVRAAASELPPT